MRRDRFLFPPDAAGRFSSQAGKLYRPSNGSEGDMFQARWCSDCEHDDPAAEKYCPIIAASMAFDSDEPGYPKEWTYAENGQPCCTAHTLIQWPLRPVKESAP